MTKARKYVYDDNLCAHYHVISRIVQGAFLFGIDSFSNDYFVVSGFLL